MYKIVFRVLEDIVKKVILKGLRGDVGFKVITTNKMFTFESSMKVI